LLGPDGSPAQSQMYAFASDRFGNVYGSSDGVAMKWLPDGTPVGLGKSNGRNTQPSVANNNGAFAGVDVGGTVGDPVGEFLPFIYRNNQFTRIDIPQLHDITVHGIWDDGTVIGSGVNRVPDYYGNFGSYTWYWKEGQVRFLQGDPDHPIVRDGIDGPSDFITGANTSGWAVGSNIHGASLYDAGGGIYTLQGLLADPEFAARARIDTAYAINDVGQIVVKAFAYDSPPLTDNWYILTPVPEPATSIPLIAGITLLARRRR
jgi:hypothetical protein